MILPVIQTIASSFEAGDMQQRKFGKALLLGTAYSASSGGLGTIIGTPPNGVLVAQSTTFGIRITFARWMGFGAPLAIIMICLIWLYLVFSFQVSFKDLPSDHPAREALQRKFGPMSQAEWRVGAVFFFTVLFWMIRKPLVQALGLERGRLEDDTVSIIAAICLFLIPAKNDKGETEYLMDWPTLLKTPWHILLLFGGGFALATAFKATNLSTWLGSQLVILGSLPPFLVVLLMVLMVTFLTEVTSNTATANVLLPIIGELSCSLGVMPATFMVPATLAASCAFMLPVATPPNAIVFATKRITMKDMALTGLGINLASAVLITVWMFTWGHIWFDMDASGGRLEEVCK